MVRALGISMAFQYTGFRLIGPLVPSRGAERPAGTRRPEGERAWTIRERHRPSRGWYRGLRRDAALLLVS